MFQTSEKADGIKEIPSSLVCLFALFACSWSGLWLGFDVAWAAAETDVVHKR